MKKKLIPIILCCLMFCLTACSSTSTPKYTLTFNEGKAVSGEDMGVDFDMVGLFFELTNSSGETALPCDLVDVKAFQNGKELTIMVFTGQKTEGAIQCDSSVQDGASAKVVWLYQLEDNSDVSVECSDGQKFTVELK